MLQWCRITLAQTIDVHDGHQVVKLVVGGKGHGLPDRSFRHLPVAKQAVHTVAEVENRKPVSVCLTYYNVWLVNSIKYCTSCRITTDFLQNSKFLVSSESKMR